MRERPATLFPDVPAFHGWHRASAGPWQRVAEGASRDACWQDLLGQKMPSGDAVVLPAGQHPDDAKRRHSFPKRASRG